MKWTYEKYLEKCLQTWGGEHRKERALLGIIGELGECVDKYKKYLRGDYGTDEQAFKKDLMLELGDVYYYVTVACYENDILEVHDAFKEYKIKLNDYYDTTTDILVNSSMLATESVYNDDTESIFYNISGIIKCFNLDIDTILNMNIEKLASRKKRGVINGSGDNR